jgi:hypothetical protein
MAVLWQEGPPEGHSSPGTQMASLAPQFTEQPGQLPRGVEGGTLQELLPAAPSLLPGSPAAVLWDGPVSVAGRAAARFPVDAQPASERAMSTPAAGETPERMRQERVLTSPC